MTTWDGQPALTEEEWGRVGSGQIDRGDGLIVFGINRKGEENILISSEPWEGDSIQPEMKHALAALCLKDQPYGFTMERLALQEELHRALVDFDTGWIYNMGAEAIAALGEDLARIKALLPEEKT